MENSALLPSEVVCNVAQSELFSGGLVNNTFVMEIELVFHSVCLTFEVLFMKIPDFFNI